MSMIRDMMPGFELFQPATAQDAVALLERYGDDGWALAGGLDTFDWFKDRIKRPRAVIDLGAIESLRGVRAASGGGLEIGAMTTLTEVAKNADVKKSYALLAKAAGLVATPQIRNQGTIGGNVCQDTRCWYYRGGWPCYRAGGNICYADTPQSMNREHCVFGASRCVAVNPSDTAGALVALDASMVVLGRGGEKVVKAEEFFIGPAVDITRMTVLRPGEMLTAIRLAGGVGGRALLLREGARPPELGLRAGVGGGRDEGRGWHRPRRATGGEQRGALSGALEGRRGPGARQGGQRSGGAGGGRHRDPRRAAAAPEQLQGAADAQPGAAREACATAAASVRRPRATA